MPNPFQPLIMQVLLGLLRNVAGSAFSMLAARDLITGDQVQAGASALVVLATLGFTAWDKWKRHTPTRQTEVVQETQLNPPEPAERSSPSDYFHS